MTEPSDRPPRGTENLGWMRLVAAFLDERNIKWLLAVGIALILAASAYFVHVNWDLFQSYTFLQYLLVAGFTAVCTGLGTLLTERAGLPSTGRAFHLTAFFLVPLNFVAMALPEIALFSTKGSAREVGWAIGAAAYPFLWWVLDRCLRALAGGGSARLTFALIGSAGLLPLSGPGSPLAPAFAAMAWAMAVFGLAEVRHELVLRRRISELLPLLLPSAGLIGAFVAHCQVAAPSGGWMGLAISAAAILLLHLSGALREALGRRGGDVGNTAALFAHILLTVGTVVAYDGKFANNPAFATALALQALVLASTATVLGSVLARRLAMVAVPAAALAALAAVPELRSVLEAAATQVLGPGAPPMVLAMLAVSVAYAALADRLDSPEPGSWSGEALAFSAAAGAVSIAGALGSARSAAPVMALWTGLFAFGWHRLRVADLLLAAMLSGLTAASAAVLLAGGGTLGIAFLSTGAAAVFLVCTPVRNAGRPGPAMRLLAATTSDPAEGAAILSLGAGLVACLALREAGLVPALVAALLAAVAGWGVSARRARLREIAWLMSAVSLFQLRGVFDSSTFELLIWRGWNPAALGPLAMGAGLWLLGLRLRLAYESSPPTSLSSFHPLELSGLILAAAGTVVSPFHLPAGAAGAAGAALLFAVASGVYRLRPFLTLALASASMAALLAAHAAGGIEAARWTLALVATALAACAFVLRERLQAAFTPVTPWGKSLEISPPMDLALAGAALLCWLDLPGPAASAAPGACFSWLGAAIFAAGAIFYSTDLLTVPALMGAGLFAFAAHTRGWPLAVLLFSVALRGVARLAAARQSGPSPRPYGVASDLCAGLATLSAVVAPAPLASALTLFAVAAWQLAQAADGPLHTTAGYELALIATARVLELAHWPGALRIAAVAAANLAAELLWPAQGRLPAPRLGDVPTTLANVPALLAAILVVDPASPATGLVMLLGAAVTTSCARVNLTSELVWTTLGLVIAGIPLAAGVRDGTTLAVLLALEAAVLLAAKAFCERREAPAQLTLPLLWTARALTLAAGVFAFSRAVGSAATRVDPLFGWKVAASAWPAIALFAAALLSHFAGGRLRAGGTVVFACLALFLGLLPRCPTASIEVSLLAVLAFGMSGVRGPRPQAGDLQPSEGSLSWRLAGAAIAAGLFAILTAGWLTSLIPGTQFVLSPRQLVFCIALQAVLLAVEAALRPAPGSWGAASVAATVAVAALMRLAGAPLVWCAEGAAWFALVAVLGARRAGRWQRGEWAVDFGDEAGGPSLALRITRGCALLAAVAALTGLPGLPAATAAALLAVAAAHWHLLAPGNRADIAFVGASALGSLSVVCGAFGVARARGATLEDLFLQPYFTLTALVMAAGWSAAERALSGREPLFRAATAGGLATAFAGAAFAGSVVVLPAAAGWNGAHVARLATVFLVQLLTMRRVHGAAPVMARVFGALTLALWGCLVGQVFWWCCQTYHPAAGPILRLSFAALLAGAAGYRMASWYLRTRAPAVESGSAGEAEAFGQLVTLGLQAFALFIVSAAGWRANPPVGDMAGALAASLAGLCLFSSVAGQLLFWTTFSAAILVPAVSALYRSNLLADDVLRQPLLATILAGQALILWALGAWLQRVSSPSWPLQPSPAQKVRVALGWATGLLSCAAFAGVFEQIASEASRISPSLMRQPRFPSGGAPGLALLPLLLWIAVLHAAARLLTEARCWHRSAVLIGCISAYVATYRGLVAAQLLSVVPVCAAIAATSLALLAAGELTRGFGLDPEEWDTLSTLFDGSGFVLAVAAVLAFCARDSLWPSAQAARYWLQVAAGLLLAGGFLLEKLAAVVPILRRSFWWRRLAHLGAALAFAGAFEPGKDGGWAATGALVAASAAQIWTASRLASDAWGFCGTGLAVAAGFHAAWVGAAPRSYELLFSWPGLTALAVALSRALEALPAPAWLEAGRVFFGEGLLPLGAALAIPVLAEAGRVGLDVPARFALLCALVVYVRSRKGFLPVGVAAVCLGLVAWVEAVAWTAGGAGPWSAPHLPAVAAALAIAAFAWDECRRRPQVLPWLPPELQEPGMPRVVAAGGLAAALTCFSLPQGLPGAVALLGVLAVSAVFWLRTARETSSNGAAILGCATAYAAAYRAAEALGWVTPAPLCLLFSATSLTLLAAGFRSSGFGLEESNWKGLSSNLDVLGLLGAAASVVCFFALEVRWPGPVARGFFLHAAALVLLGASAVLDRVATARSFPFAAGWAYKLSHLAAALAFVGLFPATLPGGWAATAALGATAAAQLWAGWRLESSLWGFCGFGLCLVALFHGAWCATAPRSAHLLLSWPIAACLALGISRTLSTLRMPAWLERAREFFGDALVPLAFVLALPALAEAGNVGPDVAGRLAMLIAMAAWARARRELAPLGWAIAGMTLTALAGLAAWLAAGPGPWSEAHLPAASAVLAAAGFAWDLARRRPGAAAWLPAELQAAAAPRAAAAAGLGLAFYCCLSVQGPAASAAILFVLASSSVFWLRAANETAGNAAAAIGCATAYGAAYRAALLFGWQAPAALLAVVAATSLALLAAGSRGDGFGLKNTDWKALSGLLDGLGFASAVAAVAMCCFANLPWPTTQARGFWLQLAAAILLAAAFVLERSNGVRSEDSEEPRGARWSRLLDHTGAALALAGLLPAWSDGGWAATAALAIAALAQLWSASRRSSGTWATGGLGLALATTGHALWMLAAPRSAKVLLDWPVLAVAALGAARALAAVRSPSWFSGPCALYAAGLESLAALLAIPSLAAAGSVGGEPAARLALLAAMAAAVRRRRNQPVLGQLAAGLALMAFTIAAAWLAAGSGPWSIEHMPVVAAVLAGVGILWDRALRQPRMAAWLPEELRLAAPARFSVGTALLLAVACFWLPPSPVNVAAITLVLAAAGVFCLRTAHETGNETAVYLGEGCLAGVYVYLRTSNILHGSEYAGFLGVLLDFVLLAASQAAAKWRNPVYARPMARTALTLPFLLMAALLHRGPTPANILMVFASGAFYSSASIDPSLYALRFLAAGLYNAGLAMVWTRLEFLSWQAYLSPVGMTLLWATELERGALSTRMRSRLRTFASLLVLGAPAIEFATRQSVGNMLNLAALCVAAIFGGIWLRVRIFLYFGAVLLAGDLVGFVVSRSLEAQLSAVWLLLGAGGLVIAIAAFFEKKRAELLERVGELMAALEKWE